jgi:hypothetical protein
MATSKLIVRSRLLPILSVVSLLFAVMVTAQMVRSYWRYDHLAWGGDFREVHAFSDSGRLVLIRRKMLGTGFPNHKFLGLDTLRISPATSVRRPNSGILGFNCGSDPVWKQRPGQGLQLVVDNKWVSFPHWAPLPMCSIFPFLWWRKNRRGNRAGLCPNCGYDTRANPDRCSECGHVIKTAA